MNALQDPEVLDRAGLARAAQLIAGRHSVRRYAAEAVPDDIVEELLRCATRAPSAHNRQPWRFAVLHGEAGKTRLARAMGERLRRDRLTDGDDAALVNADVARSIERVTGAPVVILVASSLQDMDGYPEEQRRAAEAAMAVQNLLLAASAAGLGACWVCAPLFCPDTASRALELPADWQPQGLVTLGVPQGAPRLRDRHPLADIVRGEGQP